MRKFSSSNVYRPFQHRKSVELKNIVQGVRNARLRDIAQELINNLVMVNPKAENIADQVWDLVMSSTPLSTRQILALVNSLNIPIHQISEMEEIVEQAMQHQYMSKYARSNRYSFNNTSSFYKTLPETNYDVYDQDLYAGDEYLYDDMGGLSESDFSSDLMADFDDGDDDMAGEFFAGRRWKGEPGKKYDKPPALDNSNCYSSKDWKGKGTPGEGTCYRLHNDYGSANAGKPGSKERAEYNRKWREEWNDSKSIKRKTKPGNNWK